MQSNHPIPQNVTQYQFRLVGDMTLKQFLELAGGLLLAYLFYSSNLIFIFKYPLAIGSILLGVALAFFPIEDRPLDVWIINFIKAIYGPTRFTWKKTNVIPAIFTYTQKNNVVQTPTITKTIKAPIIHANQVQVSDLSPQEADKIQELQVLMQNQPVSGGQTNTDDQDKPSISVRKLGTSTATAPLRPAPIVISPIPTSQQPTVLPTTQEPSALNTVTSQKISPNPLVSAPQITLPATPKSPNLVSGLVINSEGKLVENAIVQIIDQSGIPKRAVRSNPLGQFMISTPLENGSYFLEIEHDTLEFPQISLHMDGKVFTPIKVQATNNTHE